MSNNDKNYGELLCEAIGIVANSALDKISFDRTIVASIVDDSEKEGLGKYRVSIGEATFDAYSSNTSFKNGDNVYVQIPNGDWNEQKIIVSKKVNNVNDPVAYKDPFASFVDVSENLVPENLGVRGLVANGGILRTLIWQSIPGEIYYGYSRLAIKASFKTLLKKLGAKFGDYGLILSIDTTSEEDPDKIETNACILSCKDMIGDPYNFDVYFEQKKLFDISKYNNISNMELYFYQNNQFKTIEKNEDGEYKSISYPQGDVPNNIFVNQISVSLGNDISEFSDGNDTLVLYTMNSSQYDIKLDQDNNLKKLQVRWIHKFENGNIEVVDVNDEIKYTLTWYQQKFGAQSDNVYSGVDWIPLSRQHKESATADITYPTTEHYPQNIGNPGFNYSYLMPDAEFKKEEKVKAQIIYWVGQSKTVITSNILTFENVDDVVNPATADFIQGLNISCQDIENGKYLIYGKDGKLLEPSQGQTVREFKLLFFNTVPTNNTAADLTDATRVEWIIPAEKTMIQLVEDPGELNEDDKCYHIIREGNPVQNITLQYKIKNTFSYAYGNNTIKCKIIRNNKEYTASKDLLFGTMGTNGTEYTFFIQLQKATGAVDAEHNSIYAWAQALSLNDNISEGVPRSYRVVAMLTDSKGQEMQIDGSKVTWSWHTKSDNNNIYIESLDVAGNPKAIGWNNNTSPSTVKKDNYCILKATLEDWGDYTLEAYLPIAISASPDYIFNGADIIKYSSLGYADEYYQDPHTLDGIENLNWGISMVGNTSTKPHKPSDPYAPKLKDNNALQPCQIFIEDSTKNIAVYAYDNTNRVYWSQPLYIFQEKYPSSIINSWNGELEINKDGNFILAAKIAAGKKNGDNTFSGVMMGDWEGDETSHAEGAITDNTGIYGFYEGIPSFGFKDDGTAFIGKPGTGRLELNGNKGKIESSGYYVDGGTGMLIDFGGEDDTPLIHMKHNSSTTTSDIRLQAGESGSYIELSKNNGSIILDIGRDDYPSLKLEYDNDDEDNHIYSAIDLQTGPYESYIELENNQGSLLLSSGRGENKPPQIKLEYEQGNNKSSINLEAGAEESYIKLKRGNKELLLSAGNGTDPIPKIELKNGSNRITLSTEDDGSEIYLTRGGNNYIKIASKELDENNNVVHPLTIGRKFYVEWDGTIHAFNGYFTGQITSDNGIFENITVTKRLGAYEGDFDYLKAYSPQFGQVQFGINYGYTWEYKIRDNVNSGWRSVTETVYNSHADKDSDGNLLRAKSKVMNQQYNGQSERYSGFLGAMYGQDSDNKATDVIGFRNIETDIATVIEGTGGVIRIGNNGIRRTSKDTVGTSIDLDDIILSGGSLRYHINGGIVGTKSDMIHSRYIIDSNGLELKCYETTDGTSKNQNDIGGLYITNNMTTQDEQSSKMLNKCLYLGGENIELGPKGFNGITSVESIKLIANKIEFNCPADQQTGIYARFA